MLINTSRSLEDLGLDEFAARLPPRSPADRAGERDRAPSTSAAGAEHCPARRLRGADRAWSRSEAVVQAIGQKFSGDVADAQHVAAARGAYDYVQREIRELARA